MNAADRTGPDGSVLDSSVESPATFFPFHCSPTSGFRRVGLGNGQTLQLVVSFPTCPQNLQAPEIMYLSSLIMWTTNGHMTVLGGFGQFVNDWTTQTAGYPFTFYQEVSNSGKFTFEFHVIDPDQLEVTFWKNGGENTPWSPSAAHAEKIGYQVCSNQAGFYTAPVGMCYGWPPPPVRTCGGVRGIPGMVYHSATIL